MSEERKKEQETEGIQMVKQQKIKDFAELERRATTKPYITRLWLAPVLIVTGHFLMIATYAAFVTGMWWLIASLPAGVACYRVGFHDEDIREAKPLYKCVLEGPSVELKTYAARSLLTWWLVMPLVVWAVGPLSFIAIGWFGFGIPNWLLTIWIIGCALFPLFLFPTAGIMSARNKRGKIEAYQRGRKQQISEFDELKLEIMEILIENQGVFPDMEDPIEILYAKTMKDVVEMQEEVRESAEEVKADDGMPEYAQKLAEEVLTKLKRMRALASGLV